MRKETGHSTLQISAGYRSARRTLSIVCAIALAWSAAQFDLTTVDLGFSGALDISRASIPLILICAIAYSTTRCILEFAMQAVEVRQWRLAQADIKLSLFLVQASVLMLAASGLSRSVDTIFYLAIAALVVLLGSRIAHLVAMMALMPLLIYLRSRQGRTSIASRAIESAAWAELIVVLILVTLFITIGVASLRYEPLRLLWVVPPHPLALGLFVAACIAIVLCMYLQRAWYGKLFAYPPAFTEQRAPDGRIIRTYHKRPAPIWDWHMHPDNAGQQADDMVVEVLPSRKPLKSNPGDEPRSSA